MTVGDNVQRKPRSLMQRLASAAGAETGEATRERIVYRSGIGVYFGLGLAGGGMAGAAALLAVHLFAPDQAAASRLQIPAAIAALGHWMPDVATPGLASYSRPVAVREPQPDAFEMVIDRSSRANAPFGLRLVGSQNGGLQVVLRDVPAAVVLSRGERRDATTWMLRAADLQDLHLAINDGSPDTFDVRIDVMASADVIASGSIARVRVVETSPVRTAVAAPAEVAPMETAAPVDRPLPVTTVVETETSLQTRAVVPVRNDTPRRERVARAAVPPPVSAETDRRSQHVAPPVPTHPAAESRHWPEGASGLGAVARESDRQVWWKLPAPTWSPFVDTASR